MVTISRRSPWCPGTVPVLSRFRVPGSRFSAACPAVPGLAAARRAFTLSAPLAARWKLDRAGLVERHPDPADRRRAIVRITPAQSALIGQWLDGAASPIARVLDKLAPSEQEAFLKAMDLLETELHSPDAPSTKDTRS